eukprot:2517887-Rhodomonas_salina.3
MRGSVCVALVTRAHAVRGSSARERKRSAGGRRVEEGGEGRLAGRKVGGKKGDREGGAVGRWKV